VIIRSDFGSGVFFLNKRKMDLPEVLLDDKIN